MWCERFGSQTGVVGIQWIAIAAGSPFLLPIFWAAAACDALTLCRKLFTVNMLASFSRLRPLAQCRYIPPVNHVV